MFRNQAGQILGLTMIVVAVGSLSTGAMLAVVNSGTRSSGAFQESSQAYYASAAGIELVMAYLLEGADGFALDSCYPELDPGPPVTVNGQPVTVNGHEISLSIISPEQAGLEVKPQATYLYRNPGVPTDGLGGLKLLDPGETWPVEISGVVPFSSIFVNWAYIAAAIPELEIRLLDAAGENDLTPKK